MDGGVEEICNTYEGYEQNIINIKEYVVCEICRYDDNI
jgi:hypothetical protein